MIKLSEVYKIYSDGDSEIRALDGISLHIKKGEFVSIIGQSGSGKSTAMNIIGCLDTPTSGKYILEDEDVSKMDEYMLANIRSKTIGFVFQQYNLISKLTVIENVELPLLYQKISLKKRREMAMDALRRVGLIERINKFPSQLSGGQQQRVSIARALAGNPSIILADEPTGALDSKTGVEVLEFIKQLNNDGTTIVLITHDSKIAEKANRIISITDGKIVSDTEVSA